MVVQVVEVTRQALVEQVLVTQGQETSRGDGPTSSIDGTGLRWRTVKLELSVGHNSANSALGVGQDGLIQLHRQVVRRQASLRKFAGTRGSAGGLGLTVRDLANDCWFLLVLDLTITDLVDDGGGANCHGGHLLVLDLSVSNLVDNRLGVGDLVLNLTIANLVDDWWSGGGWWLQQRHGALNLDLSVSDLGNTVTLVRGADLDNLNTKVVWMVGNGTTRNSTCWG